MCGLAGWIARADRAPAADVLEGMTDAVAHRGPDGEGHLIATTPDGSLSVGLGHRRLSIIDLETGDQPMHYTAPDGRRLTIVFNGEIYNFRELRTELGAAGHRFRTASDTEVVLAAHAEWGTHAVERLRGMFAHVIYEHESGRLTLARDRFGKKPLFLARRPEGIYFASEIKALLRVPGVEARLHLGALPHYLAYRYVPGPATFFRGIEKLPPASVAVFERGHLAVARTWTPPDGAPPSEAPATDPVGRFLTVLDEAVRLRMIADVPFGAFLSGGIDSSAVVALMARASELPVNTFSVGFAESDYSELRHAAEVAKQFATCHHELEVAAPTLMERLPELIGFRDAPVAEPSDIPIHLLAEAAAKSVKLVLTGEGADELLAGYPKHRAEAWATRYHALMPGPVHERLVRPLVAALPYRFRRAKTLFESLGERRVEDRLPRWFGALGPAACRRLLRRVAAVAPLDRSPFDVDPAVGPLRRLLYFDQTSWLPDNLLERGDRMTMAASLEARMPFMDHELAALVASLPDTCRLRGRRDKWVLREAMRPILPAHLLERPKVGFRVPVNEWFRTTMRDWLREHLTGPQSISRDFYVRHELERVLESHIAGQHNHEKLLWTLISLELFLRRFGLHG